MNRLTARGLRVVLLMAILSIVMFANQASANTITYGPYAVVIDPVPPDTTYSVKIVWRTSQASADNIAWVGTMSNTDVNNSTYHEVLFTGLVGDTSYEFRVRTDDAESLTYAFLTRPNLLTNGSFEVWEGGADPTIFDSGYKPVGWNGWEIYKYEEQPTTNPDHVHISMDRPTGIPTPASRDGIHRASIDAGWRSCFGGMYQTLNVTPGYYQVSGWMAWTMDASDKTLGIYAKDGDHVNPSTNISANVPVGATTIYVQSTAGFKVPGPGERCTAFITKKTGGIGDPHGDTFTYSGLQSDRFTGVQGIDYAHDKNNAEENQVKQVPEIWNGTGSPGNKWQPIYTKSGVSTQTDWAYGEKVVYCSSGKLTIYCNLKSPSWAGVTTSHYDGLRVSAALEPVQITDVQVVKAVDPNNPDTKVLITWQTSVPTASWMEYGPTSSYGTIIQDAAPKTSHSVTLSGLEAQKAYYFHIHAPAAGGHPTGDYASSFVTPIQFSGIQEVRAVAPDQTTYNYTINF
ncbi:MAG: hypothetical protein ACPL7O_08735, partial [Armatimonadota bacterium]